MKTILVPVDFSNATARVCAAACELARLTAGRIRLLHVVTPLPFIMNDYYAFGAGQLAEIMLASEKGAALKLSALARRLGKRCPVQTAQLTGQPVRAIIEEAVATQADCIVMGSHGHGAVFDLLVGSTTHGILRQARCPVLVIPVRARR